MCSFDGPKNSICDYSTGTVRIQHRLRGILPEVQYRVFGWLKALEGFKGSEIKRPGDESQGKLHRLDQLGCQVKVVSSNAIFAKLFLRHFTLYRTSATVRAASRATGADWSVTINAVNPLDWKPAR